jgi:hypothetical protein
MAKLGPKAPAYYGAWVEGQYYNPGERMPVGTADYVVRDVEIVESREGFRGRSDLGYRSVHAVFAVGTSLDEIEAELGEMFEELEMTKISK